MGQNQARIFGLQVLLVFPCARASHFGVTQFLTHFHALNGPGVSAEASSRAEAACWFSAARSQEQRVAGALGEALEVSEDVARSYGRDQ